MLTLPLPGPEYSSEQAKKFLDLLWEFVHDERLVLMFFESYDQILIRTRFLLEASGRLGSYTASLPSRPLTWEQLFEPDPMPKAIYGFLAQLQEIAREGAITAGPSSNRKQVHLPLAGRIDLVCKRTEISRRLPEVVKHGYEIAQAAAP